MIYYFEFNEKYQKYMKKELGNEEIENNKCFTIDGSGDSFKVNVYCNVELALKPNTIVLSRDEELNDYWWVVQEDKSTLIDNNFYLHELQLVGAIEWFKFKFCYTGTFYYHRYSYFEVMQKLLYSLWKPKFFDFNLANFTSEFGSGKNNQKFTFKGYTIRSALSEIEKALNVDFKLKFVTSKLSIEETLSGATGSQSLNNGTQASINEKDYKNDFLVYDYPDNNRFEIYAKSNIISEIIETISNENSEKEIEIIFYTIIGNSPLIPEIVGLPISMSFSASVIDGKLTLKNETYPNGTVTLSSTDLTVETTFFVPKEIVFSIPEGGGDYYYSQTIETEGPDQNYMSELGFDKFYIKEIISEITDDKDNIYISSAYFDFIHKNPSTNISYPINILDEKYQISQFPNKSYASRVIGRVTNVTSSTYMTYPTNGYMNLVSENNVEIKNGDACLILPFNIDRMNWIVFRAPDNGIHHYNELHDSEDTNNSYLTLRTYSGTTYKFMIKEKFYYDNMVDEGEYKKEFTLWYEKGKNVIHNFEKFLELGDLYYDVLGDDGKPIYQVPKGISSKMFRVYYYPLIDEMLITNNNDITNDDVIYNQTCQNTDSVLAKEFINGYSESISIGTLTRCKYHNEESECFKCGDVFVKGDERYVVSSVSIDKYKDIVYAEYKLSKDYVAKTELISADGSIESYAIPQNNIVKRIQEYKILIRFNDDLVENVSSYLTNTFAISFLWTDRNDYSINAKCTSSDGVNYYVGLQAANIETPKSTTSIFDFYDNNYCGFRVLEVVEPLRTYYAQYPYNYVDGNGEIKSFELKIKWGIDSSNFPYLTEQEYNNDDDTIAKINELNYRKDGYEIPIFLLTREYNDCNGYIFGNNVSRPANSNAYYLTLYTSNTPITSQNINFDNLTKINKINISDVRNGANNSQYFELSYKSVDESRFYAKNQNLVVVRENDSGTKELMFAINNYKKEFDYQSTKQTDSAGNVLHYSQTYTWTIYLETYKI